MLFDLHIHSKYSFDSYMDITKIIKIAKRKGLSGIAITDHNTIKGSLLGKKIANKYNLMFIPGIEVETNYGDILCLYITDDVKSKNAFEVIDIVKAQGGLTILAHPFKRRKMVPDEIIKKIDGLEVFNARTDRPLNEMALNLAKRYSKGMSAGSDAHFYFEIGNGCVVSEVSDIYELRKNILKGKINVVGKPTPFIAETLSQFVKATKTKSVYPLCYGSLKFALGIIKLFINKINKNKLKNLNKGEKKL